MEGERNLKSQSSKGIHLKSYFDPFPPVSEFHNALTLKFLETILNFNREATSIVPKVSFLS